MKVICTHSKTCDNKVCVCHGPHNPMSGCGRLQFCPIVYEDVKCFPVEKEKDFLIKRRRK